MAAETEAHLREHYERVHRRAVEQAMSGLYDRVRTMLEGDGDKDGGMIGALRVEVDAEGKVFRGRVYDSRVNAVRELISMLGDLNITNDPKMNEVHRKLLVAFDGIHSAADLKGSDTFREDMTAKLQDVAASIPSLDW